MMTTFDCWRRRGAALALAAAAIAVAAPAAHAQTPPAGAQTPAASSPPAHPLEFDVMAALIGSTSFGSRPITLTTPDGGPLRIADTTSSLTSGFGLEARLGRALTPELSLEAIGAWTHRQYKTSVSGDTEQAPSIDATIGASRFVLEGAGVYSLRETPSANLYAMAGVGWVREIASGNALAQDGGLVDLGGGVKYWFGGAASASQHTRLGLRAEGRLSFHRAGITLDGSSGRVTPGVAGGLLIRF